METLSARFCDLLEKKGKTAYQISVDTGISETTLSQIRNGAVTKISNKTAEKLSAYFGVSKDWLTTGKDSLRDSDILLKLLDNEIIDDGLVLYFKKEYFRDLSESQEIEDFFSNLSKETLLKLISEHPDLIYGYDYMTNPNSDQEELVESVKTLIRRFGVHYFERCFSTKWGSEKVYVNKPQFASLIDAIDLEFVKKIKNSDYVAPIIAKGLKNKSYPAYLFEKLKTRLWAEYHSMVDVTYGL